MSTITKSTTKTISLRIPIDFDDFLEKMASQTGRSKSNYIKFLIQKEKQETSKKWNSDLKNMQKIGEKIFRSKGFEPEKMTDEEAYNFFKNL